MTGAGAAGASGSAAAAAAIANAVKASGAIVKVEPQDFMTLLDYAEAPLVVCAEGGLFSKNYQYLMGYKGLAFYAKSSTPLRLPPGAQRIMAKRIWIPA
jgi:hypothetical protein